jgi:hypothetical protein
LPQMPEKSGVAALARLRSCVNAELESRAAAEIAAIINVRVIEFSRLSGDARRARVP